MTTRDSIFLNSKLLDRTDTGYKCRICGALCSTPGDGHERTCALDATVSEVAPRETAAELLGKLRMEALDKLSGPDVDRCHALALELALADADGRDAVLREIDGFCGSDATADGVLRGFSALSGHQGVFEQIETRLMCERMWFLETAKQPVTPPVK